MPTVDVANVIEEPCPRCKHHYTGLPCGLIIGFDGQPMDCPDCGGCGVTWRVVKETIDYE